MYQSIFAPSRDKELVVNGLHSGTIFEEFDLGNGVRQEWHEHPETGQLVVINSWRVADGECSSGEFEVVKVYPSVGCQLAKMNGVKHPIEIIKGEVKEIK